MSCRVLQAAERRDDPRGAVRRELEKRATVARRGGGSSASENAVKDIARRRRGAPNTPKAPSKVGVVVVAAVVDVWWWWLCTHTRKGLLAHQGRKMGWAGWKEGVVDFGGRARWDWIGLQVDHPPLAGPDQLARHMTLPVSRGKSFHCVSSRLAGVAGPATANNTNGQMGTSHTLTGTSSSRRRSS